MESLYLCMPRYTNQCVLDAAIGLLYPFRNQSKRRAKSVSKGTSCLEFNFNRHWAEVRDLYDDGAIDGFGMVHSDVGPPAGVFDMLADELEAQELDVLAVCIPIKDKQGLHSTAVDDTGSPWQPRRLTSAEIAKLPETFTSAHVGGPLLLNTGLWVCRLGPWIHQVHFAMQHRIVPRSISGTNKSVAQFRPEDWEFSRRCHELGLRLGATRKIHVQHYGEDAWDNQVVWGPQPAAM